MSTLETINTLQIIALIVAAFIVYLIGFFHGLRWGERHGY